MRRQTGSGVRVVAFVCVALAASFASAESRIERELSLEPGGRFVLDADQGRVEIVGTASGKARVVITSKKGELGSVYTVQFADDPAEARVLVDKKRSSGIASWFDWTGGPGIEIEVEVPERTDVEIETSGGSIVARALDGRVHLDTSGGSISAEDIAGTLSVDTSGGSISIERVQGDVQADTSGGSISIERVQGEVRADTSGGSIDIEDVAGDCVADTSGGSITISGAGGEVVASTSGGSVRVAFAPGNARGGELSTSGGGVYVRLDPSVGRDIDASVSGGRIVSDLDVEGTSSKTVLRGKLGGGGERLRLRSSGGRIELSGL